MRRRCSPPDDDARRRLAKRILRDGLTVRAAEKAAQEGGARRRRTAPDGRSGPGRSSPLASHELTGLPSRINGGRLELHFGDETGLAELVETLEALL